jgi:hypothetical protein
VCGEPLTYSHRIVSPTLTSMTSGSKLMSCAPTTWVSADVAVAAKVHVRMVAIGRMVCPHSNPAERETKKVSLIFLRVLFNPNSDPKGVQEAKEVLGPRKVADPLLMPRNRS